MRKVTLYLGRKNIVTFLLASFILILGMYSLAGNIFYFFADSKPKDLKDAMDLDKEMFSTIEDSDFVQIKGITSVQGGSLKKGLFGQKYILFYLNGSSKFVIIEKFTDDKENLGPQYRTIKGRAHGFKTNSQASKMREFFGKSFLIDMDEDGYLIESGLEPGSDYTSLIFFIALLLLMVINVALFFRPFRNKEDLMENEIDEI